MSGLIFRILDPPGFISRSLSRLHFPLGGRFLALVLGFLLVASAARAGDYTYHEYTNTKEPFASTFRLFVTDTTMWNSSEFNEFMDAVLDSNTATYDDSFSRLWDYLAFADQDTSFDKVAFGSYDDIELYLFRQSDICESYSCDGRADECDCFTGGFYSSGSNKLYVKADDGTPTEVADGTAFLHEFAHLIQGAVNPDNVGWATELWGVAGEIVGGLTYDAGKSFYFDKSMRISKNGYADYRFFLAYLQEHLAGSAGTITDDLLYHWVRYGLESGEDFNQQFYGLAQQLDSLNAASGTLYPLTGNASADSALSPSEKLGLIFHRHAMGRYVNTASNPPSGLSFGSYIGSQTQGAFAFVAPDTVGRRSRVIPAHFVIDGDLETADKMDSIWVDKVDTKPLNCRTRNLGVRDLGADYYLFHADPTYFASNPDTLLSVRIRSLDPLQGRRLRVGYVLYDAADSSFVGETYVDHEDQVTVWPLADGNVESEILIPDFGTENPGLLVVVSLTDDTFTSASVSTCGDIDCVPVNGCPTCTSSGNCSDAEVRIAVSYGFGQRVRIVPDQYTTIQAAINAAETGETVRVYSSGGPYEESITMKEGVNVEAADELPLIDGTGNDHAVLFPSTTTSATVLRGFQVQNGEDSAIELEGGGTVHGCSVYPDADYAASGIVGRNGSVTVEDCYLSLSRTTAGQIGGIDVGGDDVVIRRCEIDMVQTHVGPAPQFSGIVTDFNATGLPAHDIEISECSIRCSGTYLIGINADSYATIRRCTVDGGRWGIDASSLATVDYCLATNSYMGTAIRGTGDKSFCLSNQTIESPCDTCFQDQIDPYCAPDELVTRLDTPANPDLSGGSEAIGRYVPDCLVDTLSQSLALSRTSLRITGDLVIESADTLALTADTVWVADSDAMAAGLDTSRVEIRALGQVYLLPLDVDYGEIRGEDPSAGSWTGIVTTGSSADIRIEQMRLRDAAIGIRNVNEASADSIIVYNGYLENFSQAAVQLEPSSVTTGATVIVDYVDVTPGDGADGVVVTRDYGASSYNVLINDVTFTLGGTGTPTGVYLDTDGNSGSAVVAIDSSRVYGVGVGTGVHIVDCDPDVTTMGASSVETAFRISGDAAPTLDLPPGTGPGLYKITNCETGVLAEDGSDVEVSDVKIFSNSTTGIHAVDSASVAVDGADLIDLSIAIRFDDESSGTVRNCNLIDFTSRGVSIATSAYADIGTEADPGYNSIHSSDTTAVYVGCAPKASYCYRYDTIYAEENWWGAYPPSAGKFLGWVDYTPALENAQSGMLSREAPEISRVIPKPVLFTAPNPFQGSTTIQFTVVEPGERVVLQLFDTRGRLVATLADGMYPPGRHEVVWQGLTDTGLTSPAGLYFVRAKFGDSVLTRKMIRVN